MCRLMFVARASYYVKLQVFTCSNCVHNSLSNENQTSAAICDGSVFIIIIIIITTPRPPYIFQGTDPSLKVPLFAYSSLGPSLFVSKSCIVLYDGGL